MIARRYKYGLAVDNHGRAPEAHRERATRSRVQGRDDKMEAHAGRESFRTWLSGAAAEQLAEAGRSAGSWSELHERAAALGLVIRPRGAGLVVGHTGGRETLKASDVSPELAFKPLTERLGPYEFAAIGVEGADAPKYEARPKQEHAKTAALVAAYKTDREAAEKSRYAAYAAFVAEDTRAVARLKGEQFEDRYKVKISPVLRGAAKSDAYEQLGRIRQRDWAAHSKARAAKKIETLAAHPLPTWQGWLEARAEGGDLDALAVLRSRQAAQARASGDVLRAKNPPPPRAT